MNIKQAEISSGVSRRNIRFYEQEGLITPTRNRENDYREYSETDIETLKRIRILRMVDMPLEQIREVLQGRLTLKTAADTQKAILKEKARELETAIRFCGEFSAMENVDALDTDLVLKKMEEPENQATLFHQWIHDFKKCYQSENQKTITFEPEGTIRRVEDLTMELFLYAQKNQWDMDITREGWEPELSINGYDYTAEVLHSRLYGLPVTFIRCKARYPEEFEPEDVPNDRKRVIRLVMRAIPYLLVVLLLLPYLKDWYGWLGMTALFCAIFVLQKHGWPLIQYRIKRKDN